MVAITGPSGSGKSTLMHIIGCLDTADTGRYVLAGEDVSQLSKDRLAEIRNKYLSVPNLTRARRFNYGLHDSIDLLIVHGQLELHFGQKVDHILGSPIKLSVALLPPKAFDLCHGNALNSHLRQRRTDIVKFEGFDDGDHHFHATGSRF
jgi:energy-coupling factor transporter ATP-binding protein EcfA2